MATAPVDLEVTAKSNGTDILAQWTNTDSYFKIWIQYRKNYGLWVTETNTYAGSNQSYTFHSVTQNTIYEVRVAGYDIVWENWSDWSNIESAGCFSDTVTDTCTITASIDSDEAVAGDVITETVTCTDIITDAATCVDTITETVTVTDILLDAESLATDYSFYLADETGKIYEYHTSYKGYGGSNMASTWQTKQIDFADQCPEAADRFKMLDRVRLHYVDKTANIAVSIGWSKNNGVTWQSVTKVIGTGDGKGKTQDFFIRDTAYTFDFKIECASSTADFQFAGLDIFFKPLGRYFPIS